MQISTVIAVLRVSVCVMKLKPPKESDAAPRNLRYSIRMKDQKPQPGQTLRTIKIVSDGQVSRAQRLAILSCSLYLYNRDKRAASSKGRWKMGAIPPQRLVADASSEKTGPKLCVGDLSHPAFEPAASNTCTHPRVLPLRAGI